MLSITCRCILYALVSVVVPRGVALGWVRMRLGGEKNTVYSLQKARLHHWSEGMLQWEPYCKIRAANTNQEKMRELYEVLHSGGDKIKSELNNSTAPGPSLTESEIKCLLFADDLVILSKTKHPWIHLSGINNLITNNQLNGRLQSGCECTESKGPGSLLHDHK